MGCATSVISTDKNSNVNGKDAAAAAAVDEDIFAPREIVLTEQQKKVIVRNWKILSTDLVGRGSRIFRLIFERNPLVKTLFKCGHLEGDALLEDASFRGHAMRFMQAVGAVVDNLDNYREALAPLLNDLGRRHTNFKGFKPIYFNDFQESIMQVFAEDLGSKFNSFARDAWRLVLLFILTELKRGFTQCLREKGLLNQALADSQSAAAAAAAAVAAAAAARDAAGTAPGDTITNGDASPVSDDVTTTQIAADVSADVTATAESSVADVTNDNDNTKNSNSYAAYKTG